MKNLLLRDIGEFALVQRIQKRTRTGRRSAGVDVGIGDDAFAARITSGTLLVATKDVLVENIHFKRNWASPFELGYKAMAVNLSDLAAMGGCRPRYGLIGLAVPGDIRVDYVDKLYTGMDKIAGKYGLSILGGDTVSAKKDIVLSITLIGEAKRGGLIRRSGAKPGDIIAVSGTLGDAAGGLYLLQRGVRRAKGYRKFLVRRHLLPEPRFDVSWLLAESRKATSLIDCSDGLAASVDLVAAASGVGARIHLEKIPLSPALRQLARDCGIDPAGMALNGGEDFELVFTVPPRAFASLKRKLKDITAVGEITAGRKIGYYSHGTKKDINAHGYQHFAGGAPEYT